MYIVSEKLRSHKFIWELISQLLFSLVAFFCLFFFLTLQYCIGFAIYQNESATGIQVFLILNPPSSLIPPHTIPLGRRSAPAPSIQYRASNLDWRLISYIILYMFQCHSPKSSHPLPLHGVQKTVLYISVSFAVSYTGLLLPSF